RIGFSVGEIKSIVGIRRSGQAPCRHVHELVRRKAADVERTLSELGEVRKTLLGLLRSWPSLQRGPAAVCRHIESFQRIESNEGGKEQWRKTRRCPCARRAPHVPKSRSSATKCESGRRVTSPCSGLRSGTFSSA